MIRFQTFLLVASAAIALVWAAPAPATRRISMKVLRDKIAGGWAGQMIGVSYGAPTEFRYRNQIIPEDKLPNWTPDKITNSLNQDDLYVDMTFAKVLDDKGLNATTEDFGAMFRNAQYALWHANLASRRALKRGVPAALAGTPKYNAHANDIDFQIEADFVGLMTPGLPRLSNDICMRAGRVMNYGDGIYGGMFVSAMYAEAFFEKDPVKLVQAGLAAIPAKSPYGMLIADLLAWHKQYPNDWIKAWSLTEEKWNKREPCPAGAMHPFNIDAKLNGAYIALGMLYGKSDFTETLKISTRCGQDSDCNPASALGVLGVVFGYDAIPDAYKGHIPKIADQKFRFTDFTFNTIVDSTLKRAVAAVKATGGSVEGDTLVVKTQTPQAPKLDIWDDYGSPVERIDANDTRWTWKGTWIGDKTRSGGASRMARDKGAEASIGFEGTGAIVAGSYLPDGGKADVYLDGKLHSTVDVYPDEKARKGDESVWHAFKLANGKHSLRLVVRGEPYGESTGTAVAIDSLIVFK